MSGCLRDFVALNFHHPWRAELLMNPRIALGLVLCAIFSTGVNATPPAEATIGTRQAAPTAQVRGILQAKDGDLWFATHGSGLYRFDGREFTAFTQSQGLPSDLVRTVQEDTQGNLWVTTNDGLCVFDGKSFKRVSVPVDEEGPLPRPTAEMLWFCGQGGVYYLDRGKLGYLPLPLDPADRDMVRDQPGVNPYAVYCVHAARDGTVWMGTESRGVCRYDGKGFTWFRDKDLGKPAVRAILMDSRGDVWFGNSGGGLYRLHDGKLSNFSVEKGVDNLSWLNGVFIRMPGKLADPQAIVEDKSGTIWIGAFDSGVWRLDGDTLTQVMTAGVPARVSSILQDRDGKMWFGTVEGVCAWDGKKFTSLSQGASSQPK